MWKALIESLMFANFISLLNSLHISFCTIFAPSRFHIDLERLCVIPFCTRAKEHNEYTFSFAFTLNCGSNIFTFFLPLRYPTWKFFAFFFLLVFFFYSVCVSWRTTTTTTTVLSNMRNWWNFCLHEICETEA